MIFTLDEDLEGLSLQNSNAIFSDDDENDNLIDYNNDTSVTKMSHLSLEGNFIPGSKNTRRRSSVLAKFQINKLINTTNIQIPVLATLPVATRTSNIDKGLSGVPSNFGTEMTRNITDFKPIRVLGKGAYGKVILVKDEQTLKLYAMKQLRKAEIIISPNSNNNNDTSSDEDEKDARLMKEKNDFSKRLERTFAEKIILSELEHPNIVKLFYAFHDESKLYLLLQYIPGGELFFHLKEQGTLTEDTVAFYTAEISCALKFLHTKGIVYRDLKPENCLLNQNGHLVLTDFGLSKKAVKRNADNDKYTSDEDGEDVTELYSIIGTPEYCAPEILQGLTYTQNCDWYSLGCLIYDMLIGKPPFTGVNHKVILNKIQKNKQGANIPYYLSDGMKDILGALLKKESSKRWDVDRYWKEDTSINGKKDKRCKNKKERTSPFQSHFIFRKLDWKCIESGTSQKDTMGPIVPIITDWELAENFDSEFTSMSYEDNEDIVNGMDIVQESNHMFKGFSYKASGSYLERYF